MSIYKSEQTTYHPLKKKSVPLWRLDTNTVTVTHFDPDTQAEESKTYTTDFIRYIIFISLTTTAPTGFAGSSMKAGSCSTSMIWKAKSVKLSPIR